MIDVNVPEFIDFHLSTPVTDAKGEKVSIVQMKCFPTKSFSKTAKLRQSFWLAMVEAQANRPKSEAVIEESNSEDSEDALNGQAVMACVYSSSSFDLEVNIARFIKLCETDKLMEIDGEKFNFIQFEELSPVDAERMMCEYIAVFLFPYVMAMMT